jgi:glycosyltransferase involved in cell wall biosynthesis
VIGWTGTFSSRPFLDQIIPALELLSKERNFTLMVIGNFEMKNKNLDLKVVQWNADEEINQLHNFDIGLYPLPNSNWVSGKSGLKALQYMAMSIPPVCTAVGNVINFIDDDKNGILIYNQEDWLHNLRLLIDDVEKRERIGRNARIKFMQDFSQEAIFEKYLDIISE